MEQFILGRDVLQPFAFWGEEIAQANNSLARYSRAYPEEVGRTFYLSLYRTRGGRYVCRRETESLWEGEGTTFETIVCDSIIEAFNFFGPTRLTNDLFDNAGIDYAIYID